MGRGPLTTDMPLLGWSCSSPQSAKTQMQHQLHRLITMLLYYFRNQEIPGKLFYVDTSKLLLELFWFFFLFFFFRLKKKKSIHHLCKYYIRSPGHSVMWAISCLKRQNLLQNLMGNISRNSRPHQPHKNLRGRHAWWLRAVALRPDHRCTNLCLCLPAMWSQGKLLSVSKPQFPYL